MKTFAEITAPSMKKAAAVMQERMGFDCTRVIVNDNYYYLSTGEKYGFYTLRHYRHITVQQPGEYARHHEYDDYYQNLSTDYNEAVKKARVIIDRNGDQGARFVSGFFDLLEFQRNHNHGAWIKVLNSSTHDIIPFGKYKGMRLADCYDFDYLVWMIDALCTETFENNTPDHVRRCFRVALIIAHGEDWEMEQQLKIRREEERARRQEEENANREPCPEGRLVIQGTVLKTEVKENEFGYRHVMTVKDERGFLVWGTVPGSIDVERGDRVRFTGTIERSDRDEFFGFFKRPAKAEVL